MEINLFLPTTKKSSWKNTCQILVFHHTWSGSFLWNMNYLANSPAEASCHYIAWQNWEIWKIWEDTEILWHCWVSEWKWRNNINRFAIWIEIVDKNKTFTDIQRNSVDELAIELIKKHWITRDNVVRHKDITPRKIDPYDSFWNTRFNSWSAYVDYLFNIIAMWEFEKQFKNKYWKGNIFWDIDWGLKKCINQDWTINAKEFFYFTMIGLERVSQKIPQNGNTQSQAKT